MAQRVTRPSKQQYYINITRQVAARSNCLSARFGSIIVRDDQIISTGYNGAPRKTRDCGEAGSCLRRDLGIPSGERFELCRTVHAEQNAIINAARAGVSLLGGDLYLYGEKIYDTDEPVPIDAYPCFICKKMIINAGLDSVVVMKSDGSIASFRVDDWATQWREHDMSEDIVRHSITYDKKGGTEPKG